MEWQRYLGQQFITMKFGQNKLVGIACCAGLPTNMNAPSVWMAFEAFSEYNAQMAPQKWWRGYGPKYTHTQTHADTYTEENKAHSIFINHELTHSKICTEFLIPKRRRVRSIKTLSVQHEWMTATAAAASANIFAHQQTLIIHNSPALFTVFFLHKNKNCGSKEQEEDEWESVRTTHSHTHPAWFFFLHFYHMWWHISSSLCRRAAADTRHQHHRTFSYKLLLLYYRWDRLGSVTRRRRSIAAHRSTYGWLCRPPRGGLVWAMSMEVTITPAGWYFGRTFLPPSFK